MTPLRQQLIEVLTLRGHAPKTHEAYVRAVAALAKYYHRSPERIDNREIRSYLLYLHQERKLSASSLNVAVSALRFFYQQVLARSIREVEEVLPRPKPSKRAARVYSPAEVQVLLTKGCRQLRDRVFLMTLYGAGLRLNEGCHLRPHHIESGRMMIRVEQGKGRKDRYTILSPWLLEELRRYWRVCRPGEWLFPSPVDERRPFCDRTAQGMYYAALARAGLPNRGGIHSLRHSFATHLVEAGVEITAIKMMLGHRNIQTTAQYLHVSTERIARIHSPLDALKP